MLKKSGSMTLVPLPSIAFHNTDGNSIVVQVKPSVPDDPERALQHTFVSKPCHTDLSSESLFPVHGYTNELLFKDRRFRVRVDRAKGFEPVVTTRV